MSSKIFKHDDVYQMKISRGVFGNLQTIMSVCSPPRLASRDWPKRYLTIDPCNVMINTILPEEVMPMLGERFEITGANDHPLTKDEIDAIRTELSLGFGFFTPLMLLIQGDKDQSGIGLQEKRLAFHLIAVMLAPSQTDGMCLPTATLMETSVRGKVIVKWYLPDNSYEPNATTDQRMINQSIIWLQQEVGTPFITDTWTRQESAYLPNGAICNSQPVMERINLSFFL